MAGPGLYYVAPPVFVGGRQPYAPAQPVSQATEVSVPANPALRHLLTLHQILSAWDPGPFTVVSTGPSGATVEAPDPPLPPPSISLGLAHLFTVLRTWEPTPLQRSLIYPRPPLPLPVPAVTPPYFNTGQRHLVQVLRAWEPVPPPRILLQVGVPLPTFHGDAAITLDALTSAAMGLVGAGSLGAAAVTLGAVTLAATGSVAGPSVGTLAVVLDALTLHAGGTTPDPILPPPPWTIPEAGGAGTVRVVRRRRRW